MLPASAQMHVHYQYPNNLGDNYCLSCKLLRVKKIKVTGKGLVNVSKSKDILYSHGSSFLEFGNAANR